MCTHGCCNHKCLDKACQKAVEHQEHLKEAKENPYGFILDEEKMIDFFSTTKEDFLKSYSYVTEEEYQNTLNIVASLAYAAQRASTEMFSDMLDRMRSEKEPGATSAE